MCKWDTVHPLTLEYSSKYISDAASATKTVISSPIREIITVCGTALSTAAAAAQ